MPSYLFASLFLFLLCSFSFPLLSYADDPETSSAAEKHVELFKADCFKALKPSGGVGDSAEIKNFDNVFFLSTGDLLVAVAEAKFTTSVDSKNIFNFVSASVDTTKKKWDEKIFEKNSDGNCGGWKTQLATNTKNSLSFFAAKNVVYDTDKNKIYLLAVNKAVIDTQWEYNLAFGTVSKNNTDTPIQWTREGIKFFYPENKLQSAKNLIESSSTDGGAFVTKEGKVVFTLRATDKKNKNIIAFLELKKSSRGEALDVLHVEDTAKNCYPYFFLWGKKIVMITTDCSDTKQNVKESSDLTHWDNSSGTFYYLSEFLKDKTSFTTAVINGTHVLLFAQKNKENNCEGKKNCFTFWFSDGNRTHNVGEAVFYDDDKDVVSSSIIFAKEKLFFLHQHLDNSNKKFTLTRLEEQLQKIKSILEKWESADGIVSELCKAERSHSETTCVGSLPPEGLVGFLSGKVDNTNNWEDKYLNVNVEIVGSAEINNGLICDSAGKGAKWPVSEGNENQAYNLKDSGFTLVAPVKISGNANQTNSILGVGLKGTGAGSGGSQRSIGLWCSETGKWAVGKGEEQPTNLGLTSENCEQGETYLVVLMFNKEESQPEVHIDGKKLEISPTDITKIGSEESISYFYFGAGSKKENSVETHVTIKYVLLYNRPLDENIIRKLKVPKKKKKVTNPEESDGGNNTPGQQGNNTKNNGDVNKGESGRTEDKQTSTTTTEDSAARVGVVEVLSFMLFGVFSLLGRYVY